MMEHQTSSGVSKLVRECTYPLTAMRCVSRVYTDLAVIDVTPHGLVAVDWVEGLGFEELSRLTEAPLKRSPHGH
jgi:3-oxoadipate CoA-transferase beta subunit